MSLLDSPLINKDDPPNEWPSHSNSDSSATSAHSVTSGSRVKFSDVVDEKLFDSPSCDLQVQTLDYFSNAIVSRLDLLLMAEEIVGEKPNWTFQDLQALRDLLQQYNPKLADELTDDELLKFLRAKCFDYEIAVQTVKNYQQLLLNHKDTWFQSLTKLSEIFSDCVVHVLPFLDSKYTLTLLVSPDYFNPSKHTYKQLLSALFYTIERSLAYEIPQVTGINVIINLNNFSFSKLKLFKPLTAKRLAYIIEECIPLRLNHVYVVGSKMISHLAYAIIKPFLSQYLRSKIEFCSLTTLHKSYPIHLLHKELGGPLESWGCEKWYLELLRGEKEILSFWNKLEQSGQEPIVTEEESSEVFGSAAVFQLRANLASKMPNCTQRNTSFPILNILPACTEYLSPFYK